MLANVTISARDENIAVITAGEVIPKIESCVIRVIEQEQPLLALFRQQIESILPILLRIPYTFGYSNTSEVCSDGINCSGINKEDFRKSR